MILKKKIACLTIIGAIFLTPAFIFANENINSNIESIEKIPSITLSDKTKLRTSPDPEAEIKTFLNSHTDIHVMKKEGDWFYVSVENKIDGWIFRSQLDDSNLVNIPQVETSSDRIRNDIVNYALGFVGNPYVYGGTSLTNGIDCSSFTQQIYSKFGFKIERVSRSQFANNGKKISLSDIKKGDLIFYGYDGYIDHVALYIGDGKIIHASCPKTGIETNSIYYGRKPIIGIKRIVS